MAGCPNPRNACPGRRLAGRKLASGFFGCRRQNRVHKTLRKSLNSRRVARPAATKTASGVRYYGLRYYNPTQGRWLSRDPSEENGGANLYGYISNDPLNRIDLLGLCECKDGERRITNLRIEVYQGSLERAAESVGLPKNRILRWILKRSGKRLQNGLPVVDSPILNPGMFSTNVFGFHADWEIDYNVCKDGQWQTASPLKGTVDYDATDYASGPNDAWNSAWQAAKSAWNAPRD